MEFDDLAAGERDEADDQEAEDAPPAVPRIVPDAGLDALHAHAAEASKQVADAANAGGSGGFARNLRESKHVWDLCLALWGKLEEQVRPGRRTITGELLKVTLCRTSSATVPTRTR